MIIMKRIIALLLLLTVTNNTYSQEIQKTKILLRDTGFIEVLSVLPDSFPSVELVVRVINSDREPVWNLDSNGFSIREDDRKVSVVKVNQLSKDQPINIAMVLDESSSMLIDEDQLYDSRGRARFSFNVFGELVFPKNYTTPMNSLKSAVTDFISEFDYSKDSIALVSFSTKVNTVVHGGASKEKLLGVIDDLEADGATAFYDALDEGLNLMKERSGLKFVVAITDGRDNRSSVKNNQVILKARLMEVPMYIIGVGEVNQDTLKDIAHKSGGTYYYSKSASGLQSVYEEVKSNIQSVYGVTYNSRNFNPSDTSRSIIVRYETDSSYAYNSYHLPLPEEVVSYLVERRTKRVFYTALGFGFVAAIVGVLVLYRRNAKRNVV